MFLTEFFKILLYPDRNKLHNILIILIANFNYTYKLSNFLMEI